MEDISDAETVKSGNSNATAELKRMFKELLQVTKEERLERKREQKQQAVAIANMKQQNQALQASFEYVSLAMEELSKGDSTISSIESFKMIMTHARAIAHNSGDLPRRPAVVTIQTPPNSGTLSRTAAAAANAAAGIPNPDDQWTSPSRRLTSTSVPRVTPADTRVNTTNSFSILDDDNLTLLGRTRPRNASPVSEKKRQAIQQQMEAKSQLAAYAERKASEDTNMWDARGLSGLVADENELYGDPYNNQFLDENLYYDQYGEVDESL